MISSDTYDILSLLVRLLCKLLNEYSYRSIHFFKLLHLYIKSFIVTGIIHCLYMHESKIIIILCDHFDGSAGLAIKI